MKAILMHESGEPDVLQYGEVETPWLDGDHQLLIRFKAAGVNPIDTKLRNRGTYYQEQIPAILGCDCPGVVEAAGQGVSRFRTGDEVNFCHGGIGGVMGNSVEYNLVDERLVAKKSAVINCATAAAAPCSFSQRDSNDQEPLPGHSRLYHQGRFRD